MDLNTVAIQEPEARILVPEQLCNIKNISGDQRRSVAE
jgi:hypothetical protein